MMFAFGAAFTVCGLLAWTTGAWPVSPEYSYTVPVDAPVNENSCLAAGGFGCMFENPDCPPEYQLTNGDDHGNLCPNQADREVVCCREQVRQPGNTRCGFQGGECADVGTCGNGPIEQGAVCDGEDQVCCIWITK